MSGYTSELRHVVGSGFDLELDEYPIFDAAYRATLNQKILDHYWFREIGQETAARFRHYLKMTMNEIMPYYNQLYASAALSFNPLYNFDLTETTSRENSSSSQSAGETGSLSEDENLAVQSDMPQSIINTDNIKAGSLYAANGSRNNATGSTSSTSVSTAAASALDQYSRRVTGVQGPSASDLLIRFRETFVNIDLQIIEALNTCFMGVY